MIPEISQEEKKFFADNAWGASNSPFVLSDVEQALSEGIEL